MVSNEAYCKLLSSNGSPLSNQRNTVMPQNVELDSVGEQVVEERDWSSCRDTNVSDQIPSRELPG